jgi:molybdopterin converting factor small subunit
MSDSATPATLRILYFAWLRERVGVSEEDVAAPPEVHDVAGLIAWLRGRSPGHAACVAR